MKNCSKKIRLVGDKNNHSISIICSNETREQYMSFFQEAMNIVFTQNMQELITTQQYSTTSEFVFYGKLNESSYFRTLDSLQKELDSFRRKLEN